jgi:large subunit ribosomal protein L10
MDREVRGWETGKTCGPWSAGWFRLLDRRTGQPGTARSKRVWPLSPGSTRGIWRRDVDRTEKREFVAGLHEALADISMIVVTHNTGLTVAEATDLRRRMRAAGVTFRVAKNRLAHLALEGTRFDGLKPMLTGPTALAWSTDPVAAAKATVEFARTNDKLVLIGGALGPQTLDASGVRALAELPSLDALRARIVGMLATPATRVAVVLQGSAGQLARVFGAFARKSEEAEVAAAA